MDRDITIEIESEADAEAALAALLLWADRAHPPLAVLLRRCLIRLGSRPSPMHPNGATARSVEIEASDPTGWFDVSVIRI